MLTKIFENGILRHYTISREGANGYASIEYHEYCKYRTKSGLEDSTYCYRWEDNQGNFENFAWNSDKNGIDTIDSYASLYSDGRKYSDLKSYKEAVSKKTASDYLQWINKSERYKYVEQPTLFRSKT